jgi:hypothetical protein
METSKGFNVYKQTGLKKRLNFTSKSQSFRNTTSGTCFSSVFRTGLMFFLKKTEPIEEIRSNYICVGFLYMKKSLPVAIWQTVVAWCVPISGKRIRIHNTGIGSMGSVVDPDP